MSSDDKDINLHNQNDNFIDRARAFRVWALVETANRLNLTMMVGEGETAENLANKLSLNVDAVERFMNALTYIGYLEKQCGLYSLGQAPKVDLNESRAILDLAAWIGDGRNLSQLPVSLIESAENAGLLDCEDRGLIINQNLIEFFSNDHSSQLPRLLFYRNVLSKLYTADILIAALKEGGSQWLRSQEKNETNPFNFYDRHPELLADLMTSMHTVNKVANEYIVDRLNLQGEHQILDVGGSSGSLAMTALERVPEIKCIEIYENFKGRELLTGIFNRLVRPEYREKIKYTWGDFFAGPENILAGMESSVKFDFIFLAWILHDWSDEKCRLLLNKLKNYLRNDGRIVVYDWIFDEAKIGPVTLNDIDMLLQTEGRERRTAELSKIAESVGLRVCNIIAPPTGRPATILKG